MIRFIDEMNLKDKRVLVRADCNVPMKSGSIMDDTRIRSSLPTLRYVLQHGAQLIVCSHLGRPYGKVLPHLSMAPVAKRLEEFLQCEVLLASDCTGQKVQAQIQALSSAQVLLLENLRFNLGEKTGAEAFGKELASLCDIYCNDAFGTAHRSHASIVAAPTLAREKCAGLLMKKEYQFLQKVQQDPASPYVLITGGSKVSNKLHLLQDMLPLVDVLIIGGAMANTFFLAMGHDVGNSLVEQDQILAARQIIAEAKQYRTDLMLPVDCVLGSSPESTAVGSAAVGDVISDSLMILDAGIESIKRWAGVLSTARTVIWNGPMGAFENPEFSQGSRRLAEIFCKLDAVTLAGGGDTRACLNLAGCTKGITFLSSGGGSFLEFMKGKKLPGLKALEG